MAAFCSKAIPKGTIVVQANDDGTQKYFEGTEWQSHTAKELRSQDAAMHFFTPEAFSYYLPAFMVAELRDPEEADILGDYVVYQFEKPVPGKEAEFNERIQHLSAEQRKVVLAFIQYMQEQYGGFEGELEHAKCALSS